MYQGFYGNNGAQPGSQGTGAQAGSNNHVPGYPSFYPSYQSPYASLYNNPPQPHGTGGPMYPSQQPQGYAYGFQPNAQMNQGGSWPGALNTRPPPPESYVCHKCNQRGHWITDCRQGGGEAGSSPSFQGRGAGGGPGGRGRGGRRGGRGNQMVQSQRGRGRGGGHHHHQAQGSRQQQREGGGQVKKEDDDEEDDDEDEDSLEGLEEGEEGAEDEEGEEEEEEGECHFFCEPCEKGFPLEAQYQAHLASHAKCTSPGCGFSGSKRVLLAHYRAMHGKYKGSGFRVFTVEGRRYRLLVGEKPDEVEQWRQERRNNFPTAANVAKRLAERQAAGGGRFGPGGRKRPRVPQQQQPPPAVKVAKVEAPAVKPLVSGYDSSDGEEAAAGPQQQQEGGPPSETPGSEPAQQQRSVLHGVCRAFLRGQCTAGHNCRYRHGPQRRGALYCRFFTRPGGQCKNGEQCHFVHDEELKRELTAWVEDRRASNKEQQQQAAEGAATGDTAAAASGEQGSAAAPRPAPVQQQPPKPKPAPRPPPPRESTLLKKLLGLEADRETRLVLECVRFLVSTNFLRGADKQQQPQAGSTGDGADGGAQHGGEGSQGDGASSEAQGEPVDGDGAETGH